MTAQSGRNKTASSEVNELAAQVDAIRADLANLTSTVSRITGDRVADVQGEAREKAGEVQNAARQSMDEAEDAVRRNPLQAALVAVGFLIGILSRR